MKKIRKYTFQQLKNVAQVLSEQESSVLNGSGTDWVFDENGNVIGSRETEDNFDRAFAGGFSGASQELSYCIGISSYTGQYIDDHGNQRECEGNYITGGKKDLFQFLAGNTNVEWQASFNGSGMEDQEWQICTTHHSDQVGGLVYSDYDTMIHSHPGDTATPSDRDKAAASIYGDAGYEHIGIYNPANGQINYYDEYLNGY